MMIGTKRVTKHARILKKIHQRVKMREIDGSYIIYTRKSPSDDWQVGYRTHRIARALHRKHNEYLHVIGKLGYRVFLMDRRKNRKNARSRTNSKRA